MRMKTKFRGSWLVGALTSGNTDRKARFCQGKRRPHQTAEEFAPG